MRFTWNGITGNGGLQGPGRCNIEMDTLDFSAADGALHLHAHPATFSANIGAAEVAFQSLAQSGDIRAVVLDMSDILRLDSRGLRSLVELKRSLDERGGQLTLANVPVPLRRLLEYARLDVFFRLADTEPRPALPRRN
jgi:anti-anti-sigma factor